MKRGGELKRTPFKASQKPLARTSALKASKPMERGTKRLAPRSTSTTANQKPAKVRSRGMKGRTPTAEERRFMDAAGALPCIACMNDGRHNPVISLHHIDGRTKPGAHLLVLPLCGPHHQQDDSDPLQRPSVHGRKATFTARYGTELELLDQVRAALLQC